MIRCKCGTWTDFGMTCVACRSETYSNTRPVNTQEKKGDTVETEAPDDEEVEGCDDTAAWFGDEEED